MSLRTTFIRLVISRRTDKQIMITDTVISNHRAGYYRIFLSLFLFQWLHKKKKERKNKKTRIDNNIMCYSTYTKITSMHSRTKSYTMGSLSLQNENSNFN